MLGQAQHCQIISHLAEGGGGGGWWGVGNHTTIITTPSHTLQSLKPFKHRAEQVLVQYEGVKGRLLPKPLPLTIIQIQSESAIWMCVHIVCLCITILYDVV